MKIILTTNFFEFSLRVFLYIVILFGVYLDSLLVLIASDKSGTSHAENLLNVQKMGKLK